eukprot:6154130-Amphidinium_carterae.1
MERLQFATFAKAPRWPGIWHRHYEVLARAHATTTRHPLTQRCHDCNFFPRLFNDKNSSNSELSQSSSAANFRCF